MLKITHSLISAWDRVFLADEEHKEQAWKEFSDTLFRRKRKESEHQRKGKVFEAGVQALACGRPFSFPRGMENGARLIADIVRGGVFQLSLSRPLHVGDFDLLLVGVPDVVKAGVVFDIKFSTKSFGSADIPGRWLGSSQHSSYFYLMEGEAFEFRYLCSDGKDLYTETYRPHHTPPFREIAAEFLSSLVHLNLFDAYAKIWRVT